MRILLTGANGYIGSRLLKVLLDLGHEVIALVRHPKSVNIPEEHVQQVSVIAGDLLDWGSMTQFPKQIDAAYYLVHSMATKDRAFEVLDRQAAQHFVRKINDTDCQQIIYLTGLISDPNHLSTHLKSRYEVETILRTAHAPLTALRAGIVVGSGSASFEMIRDLVEKLPIMVTPKWVQYRCQPIAIRDVLYYLQGVLGCSDCLNKVFDIGGPDVLSYKQMLQHYAKKRGLYRLMISVPVFTPRLSSYWLILITSTNYYLARALVESMKNHAVCSNREIEQILPRKCLNYNEALDKAFEKIENDTVPSTWKDAWSSIGREPLPREQVCVPQHGCLSMGASLTFTGDPSSVFAHILQLGDCKGWCFMNWAWRVRGIIDLCVGGVGMRRGRRSRIDLKVGDAVDFWRVLRVDHNAHELVLFAEMKLPGEAWLKFKIIPHQGRYELRQDAIFRPRGVLGRLYWYLFYPVHLIMFPGMLRRIVKV